MVKNNSISGSFEDIDDLCACLEKVIIKSLVIKLVSAVEQYRPKMVLLGGGVISSFRIQKEIKGEMEAFGLPVYLPYSRSLLTDNAAMVGIAAYFKAQNHDYVKKITALDRVPSLEIGFKEYN